jgi:hypothetical protein
LASGVRLSQSRLVVRLWGRPARACKPYRIKSNKKKPVFLMDLSAPRFHVLMFFAALCLYLVFGIAL